MTSEKPFEFRARKGQPAAATPDAPSNVTADVEPTPDVEHIETPAPARPTTAGVGLGTWLLLAVSVAAVVLAFLAWRDAENNPERDRAAARDVAVIEGIKAVETMNTMDHRDVEAGIKAWQRVSTGVLRDQLLVIDDDQKKLLGEQGKIASGRVVQAALTDLTDRTARLIVSIEVTVRDSDGDTDPAVKRNRYAANLVLEKGTWKIEDLQQVAVNL